MFDFIVSLINLGVFLFVLTAFLVFIGLKSNKNFYKHAFYNLAAVFFSLFIYEAVVLNNGNKKNVKFHGDITAGDFFYKDKDYVLGYGPPRADGVYSSIKLLEKDTIYSVKYTIKDTMRFTPNSNYNSDEYRIFLGCSQIFGEGLNDIETLPYYYNKFFEDKFNIRNYGFGGYGDHQALAMVENFIIKDSTLITNPKNVIVFYDFYYWHIARSAGYTHWDKIGPWYEIEGGKLVYKGSLVDKYKIRNIKFIGTVYGLLWFKSNIYNQFFDPNRNFGTINDIEQTDIKRTMFIIRKMNTILSENGIDFYLLVDKETSENNLFEQFFLKNDISTFCLQCEISDLERNEAYRIKGDGHWTSKLNELRAKLLSEKLQIN